MRNTTQAIEDAHLLSAMRQGDKKAYGTLFGRYYPMLCAFGNKFVKLEDAEEIVQDVMLWLWENRETQTFDTSFRQYLFKAVYHRSINQLTRQQSQLRAETRFYEYMLEILQDIDYQQMEELKEHISQAIHALPASYREAFVMHRFENKSYKEIAEILQVSTQTVNYRIQQALKQLRVSLKDYLPLILFISLPAEKQQEILINIITFAIRIGILSSPSIDHHLSQPKFERSEIAGYTTADAIHTVKPEAIAPIGVRIVQISQENIEHPTIDKTEIDNMIVIKTPS